MSDISVLKVNNTSYSIKDAEARTNKTDKVTGAVSGNLTSLDATGNLTDSGVKGDVSTTTLNGNPLSFPTDSEQAARECVITFEPIQAGSGDPSPSNVRAISGYDKVEVTNNLWKQGEFSEIGKYLTANGTETSGENFAISDYIEVVPGLSYDYCIPNGVTSNVPAICWYDANKTYISGEATSNRNKITVTMPSNAKYIRFSVYTAANTNNNYWLVLSDQTTSKYYSEPLPETVYGGTLNVETGELVVDTAIKKFTSSDEWVQGSLHDGVQRFLHTVSPAMKNPDNNIYGVPNVKACNILKITDIEEIGNYEVRNLVNSRIDVGLPESLGIDNRTKMAQWAVDNNLEVVYPLATPYTIHLTPTQVRLLQGNNVVTTNGTSIKLTYRNGEVATLADVSSVAESVNALGEKVVEIKKVTYAIPNDTDAHTYDYPKGCNSANTIFLNAICQSRYGSRVDKNYSDGVYFGDMNVGTPIAETTNTFLYKAKVAGSSLAIEFIFAKYQ